MSQDIAFQEREKFLDQLNVEKDAKFPFKSMFFKIKEEVELLQSPTTVTFSPQTTDLPKDSMVHLNKLLAQSLTISKRPRERKMIRINCYSASEVCFFYKTKEELASIKQKLQDTRNEMEQNPLRILEEKEADPAKKKKTKWTTSDVDESTLFGWEEDVKHIKDALFKEKESLNLVGIVGQVGTGKTTLAQKVFASDEVIDYFSLRLWVWVSPQCRRIVLLRRTLDNLGLEPEFVENILNIGKEKNLDDLGVLLFLLHVQLMNKRYLIVFYDGRNVGRWYCDLDSNPPIAIPPESQQQWSERLAYGLPKGDGSAIIITTTRKEDARKIVGNKGLIHSPAPLLGDDGWAVFKSAYEKGGSKLPSELEEMKFEITNKCNGLPLALRKAGKKMALNGLPFALRKPREEMAARDQKNKEIASAEKDGIQPKEDTSVEEELTNKETPKEEKDEEQTNKVTPEGEKDEEQTNKVTPEEEKDEEQTNEETPEEDKKGEQINRGLLNKRKMRNKQTRKLLKKRKGRNEQRRLLKKRKIGNKQTRRLLLKKRKMAYDFLVRFG